MSEDFSLDQIVTNARAAASDCGAMIVEAFVSLDSIPVAAVSSSEFPRLIAHVKPKLVYVSTTMFDAREQIMDALETDDETSLGHGLSNKLISAWRSRNGETCRINLALMCDAVLHVLVQEAEWFADFETAAEALSAEMETLQQEIDRKGQIAERNKRSSYVEQLIADPRFSAAKVGVAKRTVLAEALFPDLEQNVIRSIVEQAESDFWLATAGRKS
jgi:hypothetical protein